MLRGNLLRVSRGVASSSSSSSISGGSGSRSGPLLRPSSRFISQLQRVEGRLYSSSTSTSSSLLATRTRTLSPRSSSSITIPPFSAYSHQPINHARWQSTQAEKKDESSNAAEGEANAGEDAAKDDKVKLELEQKNKEIVDLKDKYLRSVADFRNLQDRTKRDVDAAKQFAIQRFATDLLDSIDNLDRALESVPKESLESSASNKDLVNLYSGIKMTAEILLSMMKKHGLDRFDPLEREGRKFNPQTDEATFFTKVEGKEDGEVFYTQSKGFTLNGRVVRAAKVGVVKNS